MGLWFSVSGIFLLLKLSGPDSDGKQLFRIISDKIVIFRITLLFIISIL